jgi:hypothetical protein
VPIVSRLPIPGTAHVDWDSFHLTVLTSVLEMDQSQGHHSPPALAFKALSSKSNLSRSGSTRDLKLQQQQQIQHIQQTQSLTYPAPTAEAAMSNNCYSAPNPGEACGTTERSMMNNVRGAGSSQNTEISLGPSRVHLVSSSASNEDAEKEIGVADAWKETR